MALEINTDDFWKHQDELTRLRAELEAVTLERDELQASREYAHLIKQIEAATAELTALQRENEELKAQQGEAELICEHCGVDRFKSPCPDLSRCKFVGHAQAAPREQEQEPVACVADFSEQVREQFLADGYLLSDPVFAHPSPREQLCEDEGCPHHGTPHVCINPLSEDAKDAALNQIASLAHCGGLSGLDESSTLRYVRLVSLPYFKAEATEEQHLSAIRAAMKGGA